MPKKETQKEDIVQILANRIEKYLLKKLKQAKTKTI